MPIYMDRHELSEEVTAEIVADLHQKDLKIQHKFNCKGLTYWFDDKRKMAFCLVEAPNRAALKKMHDQAHGDVANRIIEVDQAVVESFLGRIEDPEKSRKTALNIINDPAFRTIMIVGIKPASLRKSLDEEVKSIIVRQHSRMCERILLFDGRLVKQDQDHLLVSFDAVTNAVGCALQLRKEFGKQPARNSGSLVYLKLGLNAGLPIDEKDGFFENTIRTALSYFQLVAGTLVLSSELRDLYDSENPGSPLTPGSYVSLSPIEEKFLKDLLSCTEKEWNNSSISIRDLSQALGFSKSRLYRNTVALTGKSPNSFLKEYRLSRALKLLNKRALNISEVAFETGFNSPAYFSKCFQENFGLLPSRYLKAGAS